MESTYILLAVVVMAVIGRANAIALAAGFLLLVKLLQKDSLIFPLVEKSGLFWGLALLTAAILIPLAAGRVTLSDLRHIATSWVGVLALVLSFATTYLSGIGLQFLTVQGHAEVMPALVFGAVAAAALLGGVPVGPLITCGMLALLLKLFPN